MFQGSDIDINLSYVRSNTHVKMIYDDIHVNSLKISCYYVYGEKIGQED